MLHTHTMCTHVPQNAPATLLSERKKEKRFMDVQLRRYWRLLTTYLKPQRGRVLRLSILLFASIGLQLFTPQIIRSFIDATQIGSPLPILLASAGLFIA